MLLLQEKELLAVYLLRRQVEALAQGVDAVLDHVGPHAEDLRRRPGELVRRQAGVAVVQIVAQHVEDARLDAAHVVPGLLHAFGDGVGNVKADVDALAAQAIGVLLDAGHRGLPVLLPHQHRLLGPDAVGAQEHHQLPDAVGAAQLLPYLLGLLLGDALDLGQALGVVLHHLQGFVPKGVDDAPGRGRAHALRSPP